MSILRFVRSAYARLVRPFVPHDVKTALRRNVWLPVARAIGYPISSPLRPRPPLPRDRRPMRLGRVLLACDLNPDYLDYWPSARKAWLEIVGVEPILVHVADDADVPDDVRADDRVVTFAPIPGVHTALQAQCVRLLYPAIVETSDAVLIADVDLYPLRRSYYVDSLRSLDGRFFVSYRDVNANREQVAIAYNAARPATWSSVFGVESIDDVRSILSAWTSGIEYDGRRAWPGWYTDQQILYAQLMRWPDAPRRWWMLDDDYTRHRQLDRLELERDGVLDEHHRDGIRRLAYSDYNCLFPYARHRDTNDLVLRLALEAAVD